MTWQWLHGFFQCDQEVGPCGLAHPAFCGVSRAHLGDMIEELADLWLARRESRLRERRGAERQREAGAGPKHDLVFTDRLLVTLVHLRTGLPHAALAEPYGIARSTISRAIGEIRPLPAMPGFAVPAHSGVRLRTLTDVFAYAEAAGIRLRIDGTEARVRRPKAGRPGRRAFVSGKKKQNTVKTITMSDGQGRLLWSGADRPGRTHDQTATRTEGIAEQFRFHPKVSAEADEGTGGWPTSSLTKSAPARRSRRATCRSAGSMPGGRCADGSPRSGSASSTPTRNRGSGARSSATPAHARTTPRPTRRSLHWFRTVRLADRPAASRAPSSCSPGRPLADQPPADPPGQQLVTRSRAAFLRRLQQMRPQAREMKASCRSRRLSQRTARRLKWCRSEKVCSTT